MLPVDQSTKPSSPDSEWKSPDDIAAMLRVSRRTVYNWLEAGKLRWRRVVGGPVRIDPASVWIDDTGPRTPWIVDQSKSVKCRTSQERGRAARSSAQIVRALGR